MKSIDNYEDFRLEVNSMPDTLNESGYDSDKLEDALSIVIQVVDMNEEFGFNEMLPHWHKAILAAIRYMQNVINDISDHDKLLQVKSSISIANTMLEIMPVLTIHQFHS